jgi:hypothetical protein
MTVYTNAGSTTHFSVSYDSAMGEAGAAVAQGILATCEADWQRVADVFGGLSPSGGQIQVKIESSTGGGSNDEVNNIDIRTNTDLAQARYVLVSEVAEIFMHAQGGGWDPLNSKGEALSRLLGADAYPDVPGPNGYLTASPWLNSGRADWVTSNEATDTDFVSTGCAILFLNYLRTQLRLPLNAIVADRSTTLQGIYQNLTKSSDAFGPFIRLLQRHFPSGLAVNLANENPFPLSGDGWFTTAGPVVPIKTRRDEGSTTLFIGGIDGKVWSNFWPLGTTGRWNGWFPIGDNTFPLGTPVSAIRPRSGEGAVSLYVVGSDGKVWTNFWPAGITMNWNGWFHLDDNTFPPRSPISVIHPRSDEGAVSLYVVGSDGKVWSNFWPAGTTTNWNGWFPLGDNIFPQGSPVTAIHPRSSEGAVSLYIIGFDGKVWSNFWPAGTTTNWSGWFPLGDNTFPQGLSVSAIHPRSLDGAVSLYVIGLDGKVWSNFWPAGTTTNWNGWFPIANNTFPIYVPVTPEAGVLSRPRLGRRVLGVTTRQN